MMLSTNIDYISTIFKTFDSDIDKWTSKIGVFGRSFNQIGTAVTNKLIDFNDEFERTGKIASSWKNTDSIWKRLYGNKSELDWRKNSMGEIVTKDNIDSYIAKISQSDANALAKSIYDESVAVTAGTRSWEGYFNTLNSTNRGYVVDLIKNTDDLSKLTGDDLVQANQNARQAAIAHNAALKQQTLGAKAASVAMKGLAIAGNVLLSMGISFLITELSGLFKSFAKPVEVAREKMEKSVATYKEAQDALQSITTELENQQKAMDELLAKDKLTFAEKGELEELKAITAELRIQKDLEEKNVARTQKDAAVDAANLYQKEYGKYKPTYEEVDAEAEKWETGERTQIQSLLWTVTDIPLMIADYRQLVELKKEALEVGDKEQYEQLEKVEVDLRDQLLKSAIALQEQKNL